MRRAFVFVSLLSMVALLSAHGQDKPKAKGQLPQNWSKLNLTQAQKEKVYEVQAKYRADREDLNRKLKELQAKEREEMVAVLNEAQKEELKKIVLGEKKPTDKKPADKKPADKKPDGK